MTIRARVVACVLVIQIALICGLCALYVSHARATIRAEQASAQRAARDLVVSSMGALLAESDRDLMRRLSDRLAPLRHVRLRFFDTTTGEYPPKAEPVTGAAPDWAARLLIPPTRQMRIPVFDRGRTLGVVWVEGAPAQAVARVWRELLWLVGLSAASVLVMSALLYAVIGQALAPLTGLRRALAELEGGDLATRVPVPSAPELAPIAGQVNHLAASLDQGAAAQRDLSRRLTDAQEAERKRIAMELHDEMGPCLFGLSATADQLAAQVPPEAQPQVATLQTLVDQIRQINRRILEALRPMTVGQLPLEDVLRDLVVQQATRVPEVTVDLTLPPLPATTEAQDLTIYRVVQEAITNSYRHAGTDRIEIMLREEDDGLVITVRDYGSGPGMSSPGTGLRGMAERLGALGGRLELTAAEGGGSVLTAYLPLQHHSK